MKPCRYCGKLPELYDCSGHDPAVCLTCHNPSCPRKPSTSIWRIVCSEMYEEWDRKYGELTNKGKKRFNPEE